MATPPPPFAPAYPPRFAKLYKKFERTARPTTLAQFRERVLRICANPRGEGKAMAYDFAGCYEQHFDKSFVLVWKVDDPGRRVIFVALAHKDEYKEEIRKGVFSARDI